jgi:hypothetical protein
MNLNWMVTKMDMHPSIKAAGWGALAGAVACAVVGFTSLGWTLGSTAERLANERVDAAVVNALSPICVAKFRQQAEFAAKLAEFNKASSWDRSALIQKGGWATTPGSDTATTAAVASACAEKLGNPT